MTLWVRLSPWGERAPEVSFGQAVVGGVDGRHTFGGLAQHCLGEALGLKAVGVELFDLLAVGALDLFRRRMGAQAKEGEVFGA